MWISLVIGRFKTTAWRESIYFQHFICHFKSMATVSTMRRHPRGLKTNFPINTYLYILFNYCLTENLRPSHTTVKSVNLSTLFLDMLSPSERVSFTSIWQFPYINRRQRESARRNNFKTSLSETYVAWLGLYVEGLPYRAQSLKQSELEHESINRRVFWNAKTFTVLNAMFYYCDKIARNCVVTDSRRVKPPHTVQIWFPVSICDSTLTVHPMLVFFFLSVH